MNDLAVLLMAYGTPTSELQIEPYLTSIRGGRKPSPEYVEDVKERYRKIGGRSPLLDITTAQASALEESLRKQGVTARVYVGMKHWHPHIADVIPTIKSNGFRRIIALPLVPHYSEMSIGGYRQAVNIALVNSPEMKLDFIESWYDHPIFHRAVAEKINAALHQFLSSSLSSHVKVIFTAHSLPERILQRNDPYPNQIRESCKAVANLANINQWSFTYQSGGMSNEKWLGPDLLEVLLDLGENNERGDVTNILIVPIGFVADHLEILYDIDIEAKQFAETYGLNLKRTESLNTTHTFISALADIVRKRLDQNHRNLV